MTLHLRRAAGLACIYLAVVLWLTWPLAAHLTTHHPSLGTSGDFDSLYSAWVLAWETHAATTPGVAVAAANIYYPEAEALYYGPAAFGALPLFAPVYLLSGNAVLAQNLLFLISLTLTAAMVHFTVYSWTRVHSAGLVAAGAILANRWLLHSFVPGVPHISVLFYFPLIILLSSAPDLPWSRAALLLLLVTAQGMTDPLYIAPAVLLPLTIQASWDLCRPHRRSRGAHLSLVVCVAAAILAIVHAPYASTSRHNPNLLQQTLWKSDLSALSLDLPWGLMGPTSPLALASLVLALVAVGAWLRLTRQSHSPLEKNGWRHAAFWLATGIAISLPGHVTWMGETFSLPHLFLAQSSSALSRIMAHSERLRVAALFGCALLSGLAFCQILRFAKLENATATQRIAGTAAALALLALFYVQYNSTIAQPSAYGPPFPSPYPGVAVPHDSPLLRELRQLGGPLVEVPIASRFSPTDHATAMYRSTYHWQPLLNGYGSFWPAAFPARMNLVTRLPDARALRTLRRETGLAFILVRKHAPAGRKDTQTARRIEWIELARRGTRRDLEMIVEDDDLLLFRVRD